MDSIKEAISRAKTGGGLVRQVSPQQSVPVESVDDFARQTTVKLDPLHLEKMRIVVPGGNHLTGRYYDILRTQVLQEMEKKGWQFLAITSPSAECGKTVTACNLAMSISRLPDRSALLVDLDMHKAKVSKYLGFEAENNIFSVLEDRVSLNASLVHAKFGSHKVVVLPGTESTSAAAEWMASQTMANLFQAIKREFRSGIVIFDLPPLLIGSDVMSILPLMDAVLLVTCVGISTPAQIKESQKHLRKSNVLRVIVNKVTESSDSVYGYNY